MTHHSMGFPYFADSHPLKDALGRVDRAHEQFDIVKREWDALPPQAKSVTLRCHIDPDHKTATIIIETVPKVDQKWSLDISEALFNLRTALNYTAWELAKWNLYRQGDQREPDGGTQFPISEKPKEFNGSYVKDLAPSHVTLIKWLQPYGPVNLWTPAGRSVMVNGFETNSDVVNHPALQLQRLNNVDKHRLMHVVALGVGAARSQFISIDCETHGHRVFGARTLEPDTKWAECEISRVTGPNPRVEMPAEIEPTLAYGEDTQIFSAFPRMETYVREIIQLFAPAWRLI